MHWELMFEEFRSAFAVKHDLFESNALNVRNLHFMGSRLLFHVWV
jgi:hypothetical protein